MREHSSVEASNRHFLRELMKYRKPAALPRGNGERTAGLYILCYLNSRKAEHFSSIMKRISVCEMAKAACGGNNKEIGHRGSIRNEILLSEMRGGVGEMKL